MPPIRILQVFGRLDRGGAETMLMNLYRRIDRDIVQFDFVIHTTDECDYSSEVRDLGGKIYSIKPFTAATASGYRSEWRDFFIAHKSEYKAVHAHMRSTASIFLDEASRADIITIAHSHNTSSGKGISAIVKNILQKGIVKKADYLFSCTNTAGIWLYGNKAWNGDNTFLLKNGINPEQFAFNQEIRDKKRQECGITGPLILHIGRLEEQKNHRFLLVVMRELVKRIPDATLYLCGEGPLKNEIETLIEVYGIKNNVFLKGVRKDINELLQAADMMIFPSLYEGLPVTLVEAQCSGIMILASDRIDPEVNMTTCIRNIPLSKGPEKWAEQAVEILKDKNLYINDRKEHKDEIRKAGYDAEANALWLQNFYLSLIAK